MTRKGPNAKATLIEGNIARQLFALTWPMVFGMLGLVLFNLVDAWFIGRLGVDELAAMGFTFPVVTVINSFALGLGIGMSALVSRAIGRGDHAQAARITSDGMLLAVGLAALIAAAGLVSVDPLFRLLGATPEVLVHIRDYMSIWYLGSPFVVVPMLGNNAIRATGDTRTPALVMVLAGLSNAVLDYLLIFGIGVFPELGMAGAALATVLGRILTTVVATWVLVRRERLLVFTRPAADVLLRHWRELMQVGLPVALTRIMMPVSIAVLTGLLSVYGPATVAGFGVATRLEMFLLMVINAFVSVIAPFAGQNFGAGRIERLQRTLRIVLRFCLVHGVVLFFLMLLFAEAMAGVFSSDPEVVARAASYLRTVSAFYAFYGLLQASANVFNVTGRPRRAAFLMLVQMFAVCVPLALALRTVLGARGIFLSLALSWLVVGSASFRLARQHLKTL